MVRYLFYFLLVIILVDCTKKNDRAIKPLDLSKSTKAEINNNSKKYDMMREIDRKNDSIKQSEIYSEIKEPEYVDDCISVVSKGRYVDEQFYIYFLLELKNTCKYTISSIIIDAQYPMRNQWIEEIKLNPKKSCKLKLYLGHTNNIPTYNCIVISKIRFKDGTMLERKYPPVDICVE